MIKIIIAFVVGAVVMDFIQLKVNNLLHGDSCLIIASFGKTAFSRISEIIVFGLCNNCVFELLYRYATLQITG